MRGQGGHGRGRRAAGRWTARLAMGVGIALLGGAAGCAGRGAPGVREAPGAVAADAPGLGAAGRDDSTGGRRNVATARELRDQNAARVEDLFAGRFPGVQVSQTPQGGLQVRIRGATSFTGSTQPLYVVDGMPVQVGPEGLLSLNPRDIARIEVLKDAVDLAEYGVQGANGIVRISTKRAGQR